MIENRIMSAAKYVEKGEKELVKAQEYQKSARSVRIPLRVGSDNLFDQKRCIILVCCLVILVVILAPTILLSLKKS